MEVTGLSSEAGDSSAVLTCMALVLPVGEGRKVSRPVDGMEVLPQVLNDLRLEAVGSTPT